MPTGVLRHYTHYNVPVQSGFPEDEVVEDTHSIYHDYPSGKYCLDKVSINRMYINFLPHTIFILEHKYTLLAFSKNITY